MDDLLHYAPDVAIALREVEGTELRRRLVVMGVRLKLDVQKSIPSEMDVYSR